MLKRRQPNKNKQAIVAIPFDQCPAKTFDDKGCQKLGLDVFTHCFIVAQVAKKLIAMFPENIRKLLFVEGAILLVACHDLGKVSPTFFLKLCRAVKLDWQTSYAFLKCYESYEERNWGGHAGVSGLTLNALGYDQTLVTVVSQHHGYKRDTKDYTVKYDVLGGDSWQKERIALLEKLANALQTALPTNKLTPAQVSAISGLTSVADWIGSTNTFTHPNAKNDWQFLIDETLKNSGYQKFNVKTQLSFESIFNFSPYPLQQKLIEVCRQPGVYVLEAPMGYGKTEAALFSAYQVLQTKQATGIYFALPSQITSNKLYDRFKLFLKAILEDESQILPLLLHSNSTLAKKAMGEEGQPGRSWFDTKKRGLLSPFAVGTLDQALMAVMNIKHGFVRAFGLVGKVVILDEIHSYDAYTGEILLKLIERLVQLQCTVIILSATLNQEKRNELLNFSGEQTLSKDYPLVTSVIQSSLSSQSYHLIEQAAPLLENKKIAISLTDNVQFLIDVAIEKAQTGEQVLWIENSVEAAQQRYLDLATISNQLGIEVGLLHARFTYTDRHEKEHYWVKALGKTGWHERVKKGRIIIGTQVLEQSLDIDADLLISNFAPTDMLLQRLGRLWRHQNTPRPQSATCCAYFIIPHNVQQHNAFGVSGIIYSEYILHRSLEAWQQCLDRTSSIVLPDHVRWLIDTTYTKRTEHGQLQRYYDELYQGTQYKKGVEALKQLARGSTATIGIQDDDRHAQTRYNEEPTASILLIQDIKINSEQKSTTIILLNGDQLTLHWSYQSKNWQTYQDISIKLMAEMVDCRLSKLPPTPLYEHCKKIGFGHVLYLGHKKNNHIDFAIAKVGVGGNLDFYEVIEPTNYSYRYRKDLGLQIQKNTQMPFD